MPFSIRLYRRFAPPVHSSGACALMTLLLLSTGTVYAEWVPLEKQYQSPGLWSVYVNPGTILRDGHLVTLWQLTDFVWQQGGRWGHLFFSAKVQKQFDCPARRFRFLAFTEFFGHMGTGVPMDGLVDPDTWLPVESESLNQGLWIVACGKKS